MTLGRSFLRDMEGLWSDVLKLAAVVEDILNQSIHALCDGRVELAEELKHQKRTMDRWGIQIERECVRVLALHQPVASDLRRVAVVLKINGDLERLCNLAHHIAKRVKKLTDDSEASPIPQPLENLALLALSQIRDSLDALTQSNVSRAKLSSPPTIRWTSITAPSRSSSNPKLSVIPSELTPGYGWSTPRRNLERIADHAAKIAESVIYLKEGEVLRHRPPRSSTKSGFGSPPTPSSSVFNTSN